MTNESESDSKDEVRGQQTGELAKESAWLLSEKYADTETPAYFEDLEKLQAGIPLAYLIGFVPFLGTKIFLDSHPLIPRTETEYWVEKVIQEISAGFAHADTPLHILDLCAGSGAIGVALLKAFPEAQVDFAEIDTNHHATILKNIMENGIDPNRAQIFGGDLYENITQTYNYIFSNPPYINPKQHERIDSSVLAHEPSLALFGGVDGLDIIKNILSRAPSHLSLGGALYIEHEPEQAEILRELAPTFGFTAETHLDQYGYERSTRFTLL
jgi:release factor glutamine methyltransferase